MSLLIEFFHEPFWVTSNMLKWFSKNLWKIQWLLFCNLFCLSSTLSITMVTVVFVWMFVHSPFHQKSKQMFVEWRTSYISCQSLVLAFSQTISSSISLHPDLLTPNSANKNFQFIPFRFHRLRSFPTFQTWILPTNVSSFYEPCLDPHGHPCLTLEYRMMPNYC